MTPVWHAITCHTCDRVLASCVFPPGSSDMDCAVRVVVLQHRNSEECRADHVTLAPCSQSDVEARLLEDLRLEREA